MAIVHVTGENYEKEVLQSDKPVLIDLVWTVPDVRTGH